MSPSPFPEKKRKNKGQTMTKPKPNSHDPDSEALPEETKGKKTKPKNSSLIQTKLQTPHRKESSGGTETSHSLTMQIKPNLLELRSQCLSKTKEDLFRDEELPNFSDEDILVADDDMETNKTHHKNNLTLNHQSILTMKNPNTHPAPQPVHPYPLILASKMLTTLSMLLKGSYREIFDFALKVQEVLRAESELKEKVKSLIDTKLNNSKNLSKVTELLRRENLPNAITSLEAIQGAVNQQHAHHTTLDRPIRIEEILKEQMIDDVQIYKGVEDTKEPKVHEPITSTPTLITTTAPESSKAQVDPSFTTPQHDKDFQLHDGKVVKMTHKEIHQYLEKVEKVKNVQLLRVWIHKVAAKEVRSAEVAIKGGKDFLKHQAELLGEHNEKIRKEGRITDINIYANTKPVNVIVYMNNDIRDFELHKEFTFGNFGISEWDEIDVILKKRRIRWYLDPSLSKQKKRKAIELELETYKVDEFRDLAFQRVGDINKVETNTLFSYKMRAILDKSPANLKFVELIDKMIQEQPENTSSSIRKQNWN
ncbi:hypothetical protein Tco_1168563 [Tanacetum coccineum]